jgi:Mg-chelatase subunit ChlD
MGGARLATAAVAAAAVAWRAPADHSVVAFAGDAIVVKSQDRSRPAESVVGDILALRGFGTTDLSLALRVAHEQLARSTARRKVVLLLSDGRPTAGSDPYPEARRCEELHVLAPAGDTDDAEPLARAGGGRCVGVAGPSAIPEALAALLR